MKPTPLFLIRKSILNLHQGQMAQLTSTTQATVSRWERGELFPDLAQMSAIRAEAVKRGIKWKDEWFFNAASIPQRARAA